jgi:hypothetical protein
MSWAGWPNGPATDKQYWLIRKLAEQTGRPVPPGLTEGLASRYITELKELQKARR